MSVNLICELSNGTSLEAQCVCVFVCEKAKRSRATQTSPREVKHLELHWREAMPGHTQTEPTFRLSRTIIPIMGKFNFIRSRAVSSTVPSQQQ